jgi:hypothetical protein
VIKKIPKLAILLSVTVPTVLILLVQTISAHAQTTVQTNSAEVVGVTNSSQTALRVKGTYSCYSGAGIVYLQVSVNDSRTGAYGLTITNANCNGTTQQLDLYVYNNSPSTSNYVVGDQATVNFDLTDAHMNLVLGSGTPTTLISGNGQTVPSPLG